MKKVLKGYPKPPCTGRGTHDLGKRKTRNLLETQAPPGWVPAILKRELFDILGEE